MIVSCDTSFLVALYGNDIHSPLALEYTNRKAILSVTPFTYFEFYSTLHLMGFRKNLKKEEVATRIAKFETDLLTGCLVESFCNLQAILRDAKKYSSLYSTTEGHRAFDVIHVAAALHLDAKVFLTFDKQQKSLAENLGLEIPF